MLDEAVTQELVERGDAVVVERRGGRAEDRHVLPLDAERLAVADHLPCHVAARVLGTAALELVDRHDVRVVQHVDLLELGRGAELRRHHVQREVHERHDGRVALTDAGRLDDDQIGTGRLARLDGLLQAVRDLTARTARGQRTEEHAVAVEAVHPNAVTEQGATTTAPRRVDGQHGDAQLVLLVEPEPAHQLVGQRRLARAAGTGDAEHRDLARGLDVDGLTGLDVRDRPRERLVRTREQRVVTERRGERVVALLDHQVDHPGEAERLAVVRREDPRDPAGVQQLDLLGDDDAATAAVDPDVARAAFAQQLDQVREVFDVAALVGADGDALDVLLDRGVDDLRDRPVVAQVDDLSTLRLQDAPHDVDRRVVAVEQAGRGHEAHRVRRFVQ